MTYTLSVSWWGYVPVLYLLLVIYLMRVVYDRDFATSAAAGLFPAALMCITRWLP